MPAFLFLQGAKLWLSWSSVALEYLAFLPYFAIFGALGFHFFVLPRKPRMTSDSRSDVLLLADRGAARVGLIGALLIPISFLATVATNAGAQHLSTIDALLRAGTRAHARVAFGILLTVAFVLALRSVRGAWLAAVLFAVAFALRDIVTGQWTRLVNPLHEVGASLWLGTLLVLVIAGVPAILRSAASADSRRSLIAEFVTRFSRVALVGSALLGLTGITTAWLHLKYVAALWSTPYGYALDAKLGVVIIVVALGAWNWRRITPNLEAEDSLETEDSIAALQRSSRIELAFAAIVLLLTAILVSLPTPKIPGS